MLPQLQKPVNSTAFEDIEPESGELVFVGNKTETRLLKFAKELAWADYKKTRDAAEVDDSVCKFLQF
jgi:Ca2+-transporting ATPase